MQRNQEVGPKLFLWYLKMKKSLVTAAFLLLCFLAYSQEADEPGGDTGLSVVARAEYLNSDPLGNTSLYTLFEGEFAGNFSYSISNHWLSSDPEALYVNTLRNDDVNWLDWAYITYSIGDFAFTAGKNVMLWGTFENDEYDFDIHLPFASSVWNAFNAYQWGLSASWEATDFMTVEAMASTSPYNELLYQPKSFAYGARLRAETEHISAMAAYNALGMGDGAFMGVFSTGLRGVYGPFALTWDWNSKVGDMEEVFSKGMSTMLDLEYSALDNLQFRLHGGLEHYEIQDVLAYTVGAAVHYYPLENLRAHIVGAYNFGSAFPDNQFLIGVGLTYTFSKRW